MKEIYKTMTREELIEEMKELIWSYAKMKKACRRIAWERICMIREILEILEISDQISDQKS